MRDSSIILIVFLCLVALVTFDGCSKYNSFVSAEENVSEAWGGVQTEYQRRAELIPNLVNTVKGYADFEKETLQDVVNARAKATQPQINLDGVDFSSVTPEQFQAFQSAQSGLSGALSRLLAVVENYPDLKANENFLALQDQLEGTENRIAVARNEFNQQVKPYNKRIRKFPSSFWAKQFGFDVMSYFEATEGSDVVPNVKF